MAILKCKMCGGNLEVTEEMTVCECEYCGTRQTVPTLDDEKKVKLFERANKLRANCEFDKAAGVYENIVADYSEEAEGYWGLILCRYGIEYVDDPATGKKIPTCHRSSFDSIMDDEDFEMVMENSDSASRVVYREEAKYIEEVRKGIIEVSGKEDPYDIFICYKETDEYGDRTIDSVIAQDVYDALTEKGYRVFFSRISLESKLGVEYEPYIFAALNSAKIMLAFGTSYDYYNAVWVKNEWSRYLKLMAKDKTKHLIPCFKNVDAYDIPKEFAKLQSQDMGKVGAVQDLLRGIEKILQKDGQKAEKQAAVTVSQPVAPGVSSLLRRGHLFLEDGEWENAHKYFDKVLDIDPENAEAYFGQLLAKRMVHNRDELVKQENSFDNESLYQKALRFADEDFRIILMQMAEENKCIRERIMEEKKRIEEENRHIAEENKRIEEEKRRRHQELFQQHRKRVAHAAKCIVTGRDLTVGLKADGRVVVVGKYSEGQYDVSGWTDIVAIAVDWTHIVGLKSDGRVVATGSNYCDQCDVSGWTDIVAIAVGCNYTVGLKSDGRVVAVGYSRSYSNNCDVSGWTDIVAIAVGSSHTVGLKSDGTVVAVGDNEYGQCNVSDWADIVSITAGSSSTLGLKSDGRVVAASGASYVSGWTDIVAIDAGVGLKSDGTVCNYFTGTSGWTDIVAIARSSHTVGLKGDGTVVAVGDNKYGQCNVSGWADIVVIAAGAYHTVGLKSDGTVVATGSNECGQCNVSGWKLFQSLDTLEQEREIAELKQKKETLEAELASLKGIFTGKRRKELENMIAEINQKLNLFG